MHLVIVDGHAVIHRAYHSIPPLTRNSQPVNALYGFYSMLLSAIDVLRPSHLVVCLDSPGPVSRSQEFIGYRAKRKPAEHNLVVQLPLLPETLKTANILSIAMSGFEADDLIATVVRRSQQRRRPVAQITIITGDKDLMQLVTDKISLFVPVRGLSETKIFGPAEVKEKLGVAPAQVVDLKALMGDMSDNYPGVSGIGPKTAVELLEKFGSLDKIYSHLTNLSDLVRSKLIKDKGNAYLSQKLAQLVDNIPLKFRPKSCRLDNNVYTGLNTLFIDYGFKSLTSRLVKKNSQKPTVKIESNQVPLF